jgi:hypothetical protein
MIYSATGATGVSISDTSRHNGSIGRYTATTKAPLLAPQSIVDTYPKVVPTHRWDGSSIQRTVPATSPFLVDLMGLAE